MRDFYRQKIWHEKAYTFSYNGSARIIHATLDNNSWIDDIGPQVVVAYTDGDPTIYLVNDLQTAEEHKDALIAHSGVERVEIIVAVRAVEHDRRQPYGNGYGRKGGNGATAGKKATVYQTVLPDGKTVKFRSYDVTEPTAFIAMWYAVKPDYECSIKETGWNARGVRSVPCGWSNLPIIAHRVK